MDVQRRGRWIAGRDIVSRNLKIRAGCEFPAQWTIPELRKVVRETWGEDAIRFEPDTSGHPAMLDFLTAELTEDERRLLDIQGRQRALEEREASLSTRLQAKREALATAQRDIAALEEKALLHGDSRAEARLEKARTQRERAQQDIDALCRFLDKVRLERQQAEREAERATGGVHQLYATHGNGCKAFWLRISKGKPLTKAEAQAALTQGA